LNKKSRLAVLLGVAALDVPPAVERRSLLIAGFVAAGLTGSNSRSRPTSRSTEMKTLLLAGTTVVALLAAANLVPAMAQATKPVNQVVQWNRMLRQLYR
jgi:hypothetical protein